VRTYRGKAEPEPAKIVLGDADLIMMKYSGSFLTSEIEPVKGLATGTLYPFGMDKSTRFVDARDAPGVLATFEDGLPVFNIERT